MVNKRKDEIDWCCEELESRTAVRPYGGGRTWDWWPHIAELGVGDMLKLMMVSHEPNLTSAEALDPDFLPEYDYTVRYCPFCGSETDGLIE